MFREWFKNSVCSRIKDVFYPDSTFLKRFTDSLKLLYDSLPCIYSKPITLLSYRFKPRFKFQLNPTQGSSYNLFFAQSRIYIIRDGSSVYKHWSADSSIVFGRFVQTEIIKVLTKLLIVLLHDHCSLHKVLNEYFNWTRKWFCIIIKV